MTKYELELDGCLIDIKTNQDGTVEACWTSLKDCLKKARAESPDDTEVLFEQETKKAMEQLEHIKDFFRAIKKFEREEIYEALVSMIQKRDPEFYTVISDA